MPSSTTIRALRSTRPLLGVGARETEGDVREPHDRGPARRWLVWPAAAVCLIGLGGIAALDLSRSTSARSPHSCSRWRSRRWPAQRRRCSSPGCSQRSALALRDPLTGLPNRDLLDDRIAQALARSRRSGESFALLVVDLDGFKGVNDIRGHEAGNAVLRTIARRLESVVREIGHRRARRRRRVRGALARNGRGRRRRPRSPAACAMRCAGPYRVDGGARRARRVHRLGALPPGRRSRRSSCSPGPTARCTRRSATRATSRSSRGLRSTAASCATSSTRSSRTRSSSTTSRSSELPSGVVRAAEALVRRVRGETLVGPAEFVPHVERTPLVRTLTLAVARGRAAPPRTSGTRRATCSASRSTSPTG